MTDSEFEALTATALGRIEQALEECGVDADVQSSSGGVLEIEFDNGTKMVINRHAAARELWVAAKSGGFHFRWDGALWRDTRDDSELFTALSRLVSAQSGRGVVLRG
jgi:CyaY protein